MRRRIRRTPGPFLHAGWISAVDAAADWTAGANGPQADRAFRHRRRWVALAYDVILSQRAVIVRKVHRQIPDVPQNVADRGTAVIERHLAAYGVSRARDLPEEG